MPDLAYNISICPSFHFLLLSSLNRENCNSKSNSEKNEPECKAEPQEKLSGHFDSLQIERTSSSSTTAIAESLPSNSATVPLDSRLPPKYSRIFAYDALYDDDDEKDCELIVYLDYCLHLNGVSVRHIVIT